MIRSTPPSFMRWDVSILVFNLCCLFAYLPGIQSSIYALKRLQTISIWSSESGWYWAMSSVWRKLRSTGCNCFSLACQTVCVCRRRGHRCGADGCSRGCHRHRCQRRHRRCRLWHVKLQYHVSMTRAMQMIQSLPPEVQQTVLLTSWLHIQHFIGHPRKWFVLQILQIFGLNIHTTKSNTSLPPKNSTI